MWGRRESRGSADPGAAAATVVAPRVTPRHGKSRAGLALQSARPAFVHYPGFGGRGLPRGGRICALLARGGSGGLTPLAPHPPFGHLLPARAGRRRQRPPIRALGLKPQPIPRSFLSASARGSAAERSPNRVLPLNQQPTPCLSFSPCSGEKVPGGRMRGAFPTPAQVHARRAGKHAGAMLGETKQRDQHHARPTEPPT